MGSRLVFIELAATAEFKIVDGFAVIQALLVERLHMLRT